MSRFGVGYDVHRLVANRKLILGGVEIPYNFGLEGHSDADVLTHAIIDAILGAAAIGDIGQHFPMNEEFKNIYSIELLKRTFDLIKEKKFFIGNIDSIVVAQHPKLVSYIFYMRKNLSETLQVEIDKVSVKAKTEEGLGFTGSGQGIAAYAVVGLEQ